MNEYAYKTMAHIHSLKGEMDEIAVSTIKGKQWACPPARRGVVQRVCVRVQFLEAAAKGKAPV